MKKKVIIAFILVLFALNIIIVHKYRLLYKTINYYKNELTRKDELIKDKDRIYQTNFIIAKENENLKLDKNIKLVTITGDTIYAKNAFKKEGVVFRYSSLNCRDCVDVEFNNLEQYSKPFSKKIYIITYQERMRNSIIDYKELQKKGLNNITFYMLINNKLEIPLEKYNTPYFFHINPELIISNIFVPIKENPKLSEFYLKYTFKNYYN